MVHQAPSVVRKRSPDMWIGAFLVRFVLVVICLIWTLPTFGLFISSLREKDALATTGWWTSLIPTETNDRARLADASTQQEIDGQFVIAGNIFEEGDKRRIIAYGDGFVGGELTDHLAGTPVETEIGTLVLNADGTYRITSSEPFVYDRGPRFFFVARTPPRLSLDNYFEVIRTEHIGRAFMNTFAVTIPSTVIPITIAAYASYAFAWMDFRGRQFLFTVVVALMVVPLEMSLIPILRVYNALHLTGTYPGVWLAHTGFGLPVAIYLLRNYIGGLPSDLIESAEIDGASHFQIFTDLVIPLSIPALASFSIFQFLWVWNDLLVALVFLGKRPENQVLTASLAELVGSRGANWEIMTTSAFVSIIVPLIVFFALQRYFVRGLLSGSIQGG